MRGAPAVFIDRDGTLTEEVGCVNHPKRLRLIPRAADAVRLLNERGLPAVVVTNQSGVARGFFSEEVLHAVNAELIAHLKAQGAFIDGLYVCPHHPTEGQPPYRARCDCRKPKPGLLFQAAAELGLDLAASYMVGDKISDVAVGRGAGTAAILVLTGYGLGEWEYRRPRWKCTPDYVAQDLMDAVQWILARSRA